MDEDISRETQILGRSGASNIAPKQFEEGYQLLNKTWSINLRYLFLIVQDLFSGVQDTRLTKGVGVPTRWRTRRSLSSPVATLPPMHTPLLPCPLSSLFPLHFALADCSLNSWLLTWADSISRCPVLVAHSIPVLAEDEIEPRSGSGMETSGYSSGSGPLWAPKNGGGRALLSLAGSPPSSHLASPSSVASPAALRLHHAPRRRLDSDRSPSPPPRAKRTSLPCPLGVERALWAFLWLVTALGLTVLALRSWDLEARLGAMEDQWQAAQLASQLSPAFMEQLVQHQQVQFAPFLVGRYPARSTRYC